MLNGLSGPKHVSVYECSTLFNVTSILHTLLVAVAVTDDINLSEVEEDALTILPSALSRIEEIGNGKHSIFVRQYRPGLIHHKLSLTQNFKT